MVYKGSWINVTKSLKNSSARATANQLSLTLIYVRNICYACGALCLFCYSGYPELKAPEIRSFGTCQIGMSRLY